MENKEKITLLLLPYLTFCSALYHIAYWDTFHLNGLELITLTSIIKSASYPLLFVFMSLLTGNFITLLFFSGKWTMPVSLKVKPIQLSYFLFAGLRNLIAILWLTCLFVLYHHNTSTTWIIWAFAAAFPTSLYLEQYFTLLLKGYNNSVKRIILQLTIYLPVFSFATGKYHSLLIKENKAFQYLHGTDLTSRQAHDTLKLLGFTENYMIVISHHNDSIIVIPTTIEDVRVLKWKKEQD